MEAFNFKTNFIGHDGFVWWIGQIAPIESWIKNFDEVSKICLLYTSDAADE